MSGSLGSNDMPYDLPGSGFVKPRIYPENSLRRTTNPPAMVSQYPNIRLELVKGQKRLRQRGVTVAVGFQRSVGSKALPNWDRFPSVSDVLFNLNMELVDGDILASNARTMNCVLDVSLSSFARQSTRNANTYYQVAWNERSEMATTIADAS